MCVISATSLRWRSLRVESVHPRFTLSFSAVWVYELSVHSAQHFHILIQCELAYILKIHGLIHELVGYYWRRNTHKKPNVLVLTCTNGNKPLFFLLQGWINSPRSCETLTPSTTTSSWTFCPECPQMFKWWVNVQDVGTSHCLYLFIPVSLGFSLFFPSAAGWVYTLQFYTCVVCCDI